MNTLATFFASIIALFSGLLGHTSPATTAQQPVINVATISETASEASSTYTKKESVPVSTSSNFTNYKNDNYDSNNPTENTEYTKTGNAIYFNGNKMTGVDVGTFQLVDLDKFREKGSDDKGAENPQVNYSKDKDKVFYNGKIINDADPATFSFIYTGAFWQEFGKDKNHIFYRGNVITGADIKTFNAGQARHTYISSYYSGPYSFDKNNVYYGTSSIPGVDLKTFTNVACGFMKDKNYFYIEGKIVPGLNETTFKYPDCDP
jgi:hypothetical protein